MALDDILFPGVFVDTLSGSVADTQNFIVEFSQLQRSGSLSDILYGFVNPVNGESAVYGTITELVMNAGATDFAWIN